LSREHAADIEKEIMKKHSKQDQDELKADLIFESTESPTQSKEQRTPADHYRISETAKIEPAPNAEVYTKQ